MPFLNGAPLLREILDLPLIEEFKWTLAVVLGTRDLLGFPNKMQRLYLLASHLGSYHDMMYWY